MSGDVGRLPDGTGLSSATPIEPVPVSPLRASIPSAFERVARALPADIYWQYKTAIRDGRLYHTWALSGERGGVHVDAWWSPSSFTDRNWIGGIEAHSPIKQSEYGSDKPDHEHCWLLCGPCWHDGSSLQFSEQIAPYLPRQDGVMGEHEHYDVLLTMLNRYDLWLPTAQAIEARRAETRGGSVHESAVGETDAPNADRTPA